MRPETVGSCKSWHVRIWTLPLGVVLRVVATVALLDPLRFCLCHILRIYPHFGATSKMVAFRNLSRRPSIVYLFYHVHMSAAVPLRHVTSPFQIVS